MIITEKMFLEMLSILTRDKEQEKKLAEKKRTVCRTR